MEKIQKERGTTASIKEGIDKFVKPDEKKD